MSRTWMAMLLTMLLAGAGRADFSTPGCDAFKPAEFKYVKLVTPQLDNTLSEPVRMAFDYRGDGKSDIYFAERHGKMKKWDAVSGEVTVLGELDVFSDAPDKLPFAVEAETGINGIALDPDFKENSRLWIFYSPWEDTVFRLSHFTIVDGKMDMESEKIILDIPEGRKHANATITIPGGPLHFDSEGNLWIAIGANSEQFPSVDEAYPKRSAEASSSNLGDLRGSILRIHPDGSAKGYSVPKGNLGEYWAAEFEKQGRSALAEEYSNPEKVRPEIYIKGTRNPYSLNVDPVTGWVVWGEFGPNRMKVEEHNIATHPVYAGYPYWAGENIFILDKIAAYNDANMDPKAPVNNSKWNRGPKELPPAEPSLITYSSDGNGFLVGNNPITGPIYRYDPDLESPVKLPPHLDGSWFMVDKWRGVKIFKLNGTGDGYTDSVALASDVSFLRPTDLKQGPDGAIYVIDYAGYHSTVAQTNIGRIEYVGSCRPSTLGAFASRPSIDKRVRITARSISVDVPGHHDLRIRTAQGKEVSRFRGTGPKEYSLNIPPGHGMYILTLEPGRGSWLIPRL